MAITVLPSNSFWAELPKIVQQGLGTYWTAKDRKAEEEERKQAKLTKQLAVLRDMAEGGADVNDQINAILEQVGVPGVRAAETPAQLRERILKSDITIEGPAPRVVNPQRLTMATSVTPDGKGTFGVQQDVVPGREQGARAPTIRIEGQDRFNDNQLRKAGLPTRHERMKEATEATGFEVAQLVNGIKSRAARGENITPYEAMLAGTQTRGQVDLSNAQAAADYVRTIAPAYVKDWIARNGGAIQGADVQQAIAAAYGGFEERFGQVIPDSQRTNTQALFGEAMYDALMQQTEIDLKRAQMNLQRDIAAMRVKPNDPEASGQLINHLNQIANGIQRDIQMEFTTDRIQMMMRQMQAGADPATASQVMPGYDRFVQMMTRLQQARDAATLVGRNLVTDPRVQSMLEEVATAPLPTRGSTAPGSGDSSGADPYSQYRRRDGRIRIHPTVKRDMQMRGTWDDTKHIEDPNGLGAPQNPNSGPM